MDKLSSLVGKVLARRGLQDQAQAAYTAYLAEEWLQKKLPNLRSLLTVSSVRARIVYLSSSHPIASQEMQMKSEDLLAYLNGCEGISVSGVRIERSRTG